MTGPERTGPLGRGPRSLIGSALAAGATCGSLLALSGLIDAGTWLPAACTAVVLLAALTAAVRAVSRLAWLPSVAGLVAGVLGVLVQYGGPRAGTPTLPGPAAARTTWDLGRFGVQLIQDSLVPMVADRSVELIVVVAAVAVFLLVDALALGADAPALAALPLVAFWMPAVFLDFPTNGWALFWTGLAYLLLLALSAMPAVPDSARVRQTSAVVTASAATLVVAIALGPVVSSLPAWASVSLPDLGPGLVGPVQLSGDLDLRDSLGQRSGQTVLRYAVSTPPGVLPSGEAEPSAGADGSAGSPSGPVDPSVPSPTSQAVPPDSRAVGPLRAFSVSDFDGRRWATPDDDPGALEGWDSERLLGPGPRAGEVPADDDPQTVDVSVRIEGLEQSQLPISAFPRTLQIDGAWGYDAVHDEVVGRRPTSDGLQYTMRVLVPDLTAADLRASPVGTPPGDEDYLAVPETEHVADVRTVAAEVTADATTPYEQAMALQGFLRSTANFTYDTRVPPARSADAVWDFLQDRRGYCVQFATAMAIMARTLGIPTRVAVGFLPGQAEQDGDRTVYVVTGKQAHAWPELYFEGYGWVRFEPTPAEQTGLPPVWSDPLADVPATGPTAPDDIRDPSAGRNTPGASPSATAPAVGGGGATPRQWLPFGVVVGVLALGAAVAALVVRRVRRPVELTCEHAWHQLRRTLAKHAGISWSDATTPRAAVRTVRERFGELTGRELDRPALDALTRLAAAVELERYAPRPAAVSSAELHRWLATVRRSVEGGVSARSRGDGPSALRAGT